MRIDQLPITRKGLTDFTYTRYLVPYLCKFKGIALFLDADMLCLDDVYKIPRPTEDEAVKVVKDGVEPFEWPSLMYFNCSHYACKTLTPEWVESPKNSPQKWLINGANVGELHRDWNHIVPYSGINPHARIVHYTQGIPCWPETDGCEYSGEWHDDQKKAVSTVAFEDLMGNSVHKQRMQG